MIIHPKMGAKTEVSNVDDKMVQMHALDVRIDKLYELHGDFALSEEIKIHRHQVEVHPDEADWFILKPNTVYAFDTLHQVKIAKDEAGHIVPRSTLTRNGLNAGSALYDAGYVGGVNGWIGNFTLGKAKIKRGTRVGQFIIEEAETFKLYDGDYQAKGVKNEETSKTTGK